MVGLRRRRAVPRDRGLSERTHAAAQVAQHVFAATGLDLDARRVAAIRAGHGDPQTVEVVVDFAVRRESAARGTAQRDRQLAPDIRCRERNGQRAASSPEADALHVIADLPAASNAASAVADSFSTASRTDADTSRMLSKRLIAKISRDHGLQPRDADPRAVRAHLLRRDHQDAQADAADVLDAGEIEDESALVGVRLREQRRQRLLELPCGGMIDAPHRRAHDDVGELSAGELHAVGVPIHLARRGRLERLYETRSAFRFLAEPRHSADHADPPRTIRSPVTRGRKRPLVRLRRSWAGYHTARSPPPPP